MPLDKGKSAFTLPKLPMPRTHWPRHLRQDHLVPLRQASQGLCRQAERAGRRARPTPRCRSRTSSRSRPRTRRPRRSSTTPPRPGTTISTGAAWPPRPTRRPARSRRRWTTSFGGLDDFKKAFKQAAVDQFGSGWAWLVSQGRQARDRDDVERRHADRARRHAAAGRRRVGARLLPRLPEPPAGSRQAWLDKLANWSFAEKNLG